MNQRKAGALLSYVSLATNILAAFVYVPLLLRHLTVGEYGVFELISSFIAYMSLMDMGLATTLNRFYVKSKYSQSEGETENLLAISAIVYLFLAIVGVIVGFVVKEMMNIIFISSFTPGELNLAHKMMLLVILNTAIVIPGNWFLALINANEQFVFARLVIIIKSIMQVLVVLAVLQLGSGAIGVVMVQVGLNILAVIAYAIFTSRLDIPKPKLHSWNWRLVRELFLFSSLILFGMVFDLVFWRSGQIVLGAMVGTAAVASYGIIVRIITAGYMQLSLGITSVFLPQLTQISATTNSMDEINKMFVRTGRIQAVLIWGVIGAFLVLGRDFIHLWAGPEFDIVYACTLVLMLGLSIDLIQNLGISILQAKNKLVFRSFIYLSLAIIYIAISIPIAGRFGVFGVALTAAVFLALVTGPVMNTYYSRVIGLDIRGFFKSVAPIMIPVVAASLCLMILNQVIPWSGSWGSFLIRAIVYVLAYALVYFPFISSEYERALITGILNRDR